MFKEKTYKQIEASRNRRLWITNVILPTASMVTMVGVTLYNNNLQFRYYVNGFVNDVRNFFYRPKDEK